MSEKRTDATTLLTAATDGDQQSAQKLFELVYSELRELAGRLMVQERPGHTLQPTALVHEVYVRLIPGQGVEWRGRTHFFAVAAKAMPRALIDHAKAKKGPKRGGRERITLSGLGAEGGPPIDLLDLNEAIEKLAALDERAASIAELKLFGGLTLAEIGEHVRLTGRHVGNEWKWVKLWLQRELKSGIDDE